jgi:hypothetical protein
LSFVKQKLDRWLIPLVVVSQFVVFSFDRASATGPGHYVFEATSDRLLEFGPLKWLEPGANPGPNCLLHGATAPSVVRRDNASASTRRLVRFQRHGTKRTCKFPPSFQQVRLFRKDDA